MLTKALIGSALLGLALADGSASAPYPAASAPYPPAEQPSYQYQNSAPPTDNRVLYPYNQNEGYGIQTGYEGYLVPQAPAPPAPGIGALLPALGPLAALFTAGPVATAVKIITWTFAQVPALIIGVLLTLGVCKFTPICHKLDKYKTVEEIQEEVRTLISPERLNRAAEFVSYAVRKYEDFQTEVTGPKPKINEVDNKLEN